MNVSLALPDFACRMPWWGGDLQTLRNQFITGQTPLPGRQTNLVFVTSDNSGDILTATLNTPRGASPEGVAQGPLIFLIHGLTGCEDSTSVRETARYQLAHGRSVVRVNLRGAGSSRTKAKGYYFGGCAGDIQDMLNGLPPALTHNGVFAIGYSLGGNILLNFLGRLRSAHPVIGAATVSAPICPLEACQRLMAPRNAVYHYVMLGRMKQQALSPDAQLSNAEREAIQRAKTLFDFDDTFTAPRHGYRDAQDYYTQTAGKQFVPDLPVPTLLLHAHDDPWIPARPYIELHQRRLSNAEVVIVPGGGHVGFHDRASKVPWHDRAINEFLTACNA